LTEPRNTDSWAQPVDAFHVGEVADGARKGNVEGRKPTGPLQGFGQLWQKTYEVRVPGPTPEELIATWKEKFGDFWPDYNKFYAPAGGISPGEVAVIGGGKGPAKVTTGVRVIYADERSWSYMTPEGHPGRRSSPSAPTRRRMASPSPRSICWYGPTTPCTR
jgi:hypothetical protein